MRTDQEMLDLILQIAKKLQVDAVALSGSRTNQNIQTDEFQDYDVVYIVDDLDNLTSNLSWLDQFGKRIVEQEVTLGHRCLFLMLFEDGNRIDLTLCPKEDINEWVDSEAGFTVLVDDRVCLSPILPVQIVSGYIQLVRRILKKPAMNFGGCQLMWSKAFVAIKSFMRLTTSKPSAAATKNANLL